MKVSRHKSASFTECPVCLDTLKEPKALTCLHTFCLECLVKYGREKDKDEPGDEWPCPVCRQMFRVPAGGFDKLPTNFFIEHLLEAADQSLSSFSKCQICEEGNAATKFCIQCMQDMCNACTNGHTKIRATQNHKIVMREEKNSSQVIQQSRVNYCEKHKDKPLELYCSDCKLIVCLMCHALKHNTHKCPELSDMSEEAKGKLKKNDPLLNESLNECRSELTECNEHKASLLKQITVAEKSIIDRGHELKRHIDEQCTELIAELNRTKEERIKVIETRINDINRQILILSSYQQYRDELIDKGTACDVIQTGSELLNRCDEIVKSQKEFKVQNLKLYELKVEPESAAMNIRVGKLLSNKGIKTIKEYLQMCRFLLYCSFTNTDLVFSKCSLS